MLKNKIIRWSLKVVIAAFTFFMIFFSIQSFFIMQSSFETTVMIKGYSYLKKNSLDVLFLGPSQMYVTVDAGKLTHEYGINAYDFGSASQTIPITSYYLDEALKTQNPKLVALEICEIFMKNSDIDDSILTWSYAPMPISLAKFKSLHNSLDLDIKKSLEYAFAPLIFLHDGWKSIYLSDIDFDFILDTDNYKGVIARGYFERDHTEKHPIRYFDGEENVRKIPKESQKAIIDIAEKCKEKGIKLLLFKAPVSSWTKGESISVKHFADENKLEFIDLNENITEIGIDENTDFYNSTHLNISGAAKTTDFLAKILPAYIE